MKNYYSIVRDKKTGKFDVILIVGRTIKEVYRELQSEGYTVYCTLKEKTYEYYKGEEAELFFEIYLTNLGGKACEEVERIIWG